MAQKNDKIADHYQTFLLIKKSQFQSKIYKLYNSIFKYFVYSNFSSGSNPIFLRFSLPHNLKKNNNKQIHFWGPNIPGHVKLKGGHLWQCFSVKTTPTYQCEANLIVKFLSSKKMIILITEKPVFETNSDTYF